MKTDAQLQQDVIDELKWDPSVNAALGVDVKAGVVTLTGYVDSFHKKWAAEHAAAHAIAGVLLLEVVADVLQHLPGLGRELLERCLDVEAIVLRHAFQQRVRVGIAAVPAFHRAGGQAQAGEGDHAVGIHHRDLPEAVAGGAGAHR